LFSKINQIYSYIVNLNLKGEKIIIVIGGDIFDSFRMSNAMISLVISYFAKFYSHIDEILVVAGQHDQRYHRAYLENTPLGVLIAAHVVTLLTNEPFTIDNINFYGASYGEEIPKCQKDEKVLNILTLHRMVSDKDYWNGHVEYSSCESLLKEAKDFDLIITGDNHTSFNFKDKILNSGSIMRSTVAQKNHKPCFFVWDSKTKKVEQVFLKIEPFEKVMRVEEVEQKKEVDKKLIDFVDELNINTELEELKYIDNVRSAMSSVEDDVREILTECIKDIE